MTTAPPVHEVAAPRRRSGAWRAVLRRYGWSGLIAALATLAIGVAATFLLVTPRYRVETRMRLALVDQVDAAEQMPVEASMLDSAEFIAPVVRRLKLDQHPEFGAAAARAQGISIAQLIVKQLDVDTSRSPPMVRLRMAAADPATAARITDAIAVHYIAQRVKLPTERASQLADAFRNELGNLAKQSERTEGALAQVAPTAPAPTATPATPVASGSGNETDLANAEANLITAQAAMENAKRQLASNGPGGVTGGPDGARISALARDRAEAQRTVADVDKRYGAKHPQSIAAHAALDKLNTELTVAATKTVADLESAAQDAEIQVETLRKAARESNAARAQAQAEQKRAAQQVAKLTAESAVTRDAYEELAQRAATGAAEARGPIAGVALRRALVPGVGEETPRREPLLIVAALAALLAGLATILWRALRSPDPRGLPLLGERLGIDVLEVVPRPRRTDRTIDVAGNAAATPYAHAIGRVADQIFPLGHRVWAIASALPQPGRPLLSLSLARVAAREGLRVLLIDCDLRQTGLTKIVPEAAGAPGLPAVLDRRVALADALIRDSVDGVDLLPTPQPVFETRDLFEGRLDQLLTVARARYDVILLDAPPLLGVVDAISAAHCADALLLVEEWADTPVSAVRNAMSRLGDTARRVAGMVLV